MSVARGVLFCLNLGVPAALIACLLIVICIEQAPSLLRELCKFLLRSNILLLLAASLMAKGSAWLAPGQTS